MREWEGKDSHIRKFGIKTITASTRDRWFVEFVFAVHNKCYAAFFLLRTRARRMARRRMGSPNKMLHLTPAMLRPTATVKPTVMPVSIRVMVMNRGTRPLVIELAKLNSRPKRKPIRLR